MTRICQEARSVIKITSVRLGYTCLRDILVCLRRQELGAALGVVEQVVDLLEVPTPNLLAAVGAGQHHRGGQELGKEGEGEGA